NTVRKCINTLTTIHICISPPPPPTTTTTTTTTTTKKQICELTQENDQTEL
ncbi:unnamed protein product, partial [Schistosoma curassoni]